MSWSRNCRRVCGATTPWVRRKVSVDPWAARERVRVDVVAPMDQRTEDVGGFYRIDRDTALCLVPPNRSWHLLHGLGHEIFPWLWSWQVHGGS